LPESTKNKAPQMWGLVLCGFRLGSYYPGHLQTGATWYLARFSCADKVQLIVQIQNDIVCKL